MTDPKRLIESGGSDLSAELLRTWRKQRPSRAARGRTAAALGLGASVGAAAGAASAGQTAAAVGKGLGSGSALTGAAATASVASKGVVLKWVTGGLIAGSIGAVTVEQVVMEPGSSAPATSPSAALKQGGPARGSRNVAAAPSIGPLPPASAAILKPAAVPRAAAAVSTNPAPRAAFGAPPPRGGQAGAHASAEADRTDPDRSSLSQEVAAVEQAQRALAARDPQGALGALDRYHNLRPSSALGPEAALLRIEALEHLGEHGQAAQLAERFLTQFPRSPHQQRLRRIATQVKSHNP